MSLFDAFQRAKRGAASASDVGAALEVIASSSDEDDVYYSIYILALTGKQEHREQIEKFLHPVASARLAMAAITCLTRYLELCENCAETLLELSKGGDIDPIGELQIRAVSLIGECLPKLRCSPHYRELASRLIKVAETDDDPVLRDTAYSWLYRYVHPEMKAPPSSPGVTFSPVDPGVIDEAKAQLLGGRH